MKHAGMCAALAMVLLASAAFLPAMTAAEGSEVTGIVTDLKTGLPIEGAEVWLTPLMYDFAYGEDGSTNVVSNDTWYQEYYGVTSADGTVTLEVPDGQYMAFVNFAGYESGYADVEVSGDVTFTLALMPVPATDATLEVAVTDEGTGEPIEGASIYLWPNIAWEEAGALGFPSYKEIYGVTDALGIFSAGVWGGEYYLSVYAVGHFDYYGNITVTAGDDARMDIALESYPEPNSRISGRVYDFATGEPMANVSVSAYQDYCRCGSGMYYYWEPQYIVTGADGYYDIPAVAGSVQLYFYAVDHYDYWTSVNAPESVNITVDASLIPIVKPEIVATLEGTITSADGPVEGAYVEVWMYSDPYMNTLPAKDVSYDGCWYGYDSWYYSGVTGADGTYSVDVPAGEASITVSAAGYYAGYSYMTVVQGANALDLVLEPTPVPDAAIEGFVLDSAGSPVSGAYVYAYSFSDPSVIYMDEATRIEEGVDADASYSFDDSEMAYPVEAPDVAYYYDPYGYFYADAVTDSSGSFTLAVAGGDYCLDVWAEGCEYFSTLVSVESEGTLEITVTLQSGENGNRTELMTALKTIDMGMGSAPVPVDGAFDISPGGQVVIGLGDVFSDRDGDPLSYSYDAPEGFEVSYDEANGQLIVTAPEGYDGKETLKVYASDGRTTVSSDIALTSDLAQSADGGDEEGEPWYSGMPCWQAFAFVFAAMASIALIAVLFVGQRLVRKD